MSVTATSAWPQQNLLRELRDLLANADKALLCVAFADTRGVHLLGEQLSALGPSVRLLVTGVFNRDRTDAALALATSYGCEARTLNWSRGTYHPKMYLTAATGGRRALVGSANLTSGLFGNVEVALRLDQSSATETAIDDLWAVGEELWHHPTARSWQPVDPRPQDELEPDLLARLAAVVSVGTTISTLSDARPNRILEFNRAGIRVETDRSLSRAVPAEHVEPRMIQIAWDWLKSHGELENRVLLNELRVHRSSFVCALLAQLPEVEVTSRRPIRLRLTTPD